MNRSVVPLPEPANIVLYRELDAAIDQREGGGSADTRAELPVITRLKSIVTDIISGAGTEFEGVHEGEYYFLMQTMDLTNASPKVIEQLYLAAAVCAHAENNPEYLSRCEKALEVKKISYERNVALRSAFAYLQQKRRYDLYLHFSRTVAYRSATQRVFSNVPDPSIRLDLLETDEKTMNSLLDPKDTREVAMLISFAILSLGKLSREKSDILFSAVADIHPSRRKKALIHLMQKYTLERMGKTLTLAREGTHTGVVPEGRVQSVLESLEKDRVEIEALLTEQGMTKTLDQIREPEEYTRIRMIVPTEQDGFDEVQFNSIPALRRLKEYRNMQKKGEEIPEASVALAAWLVAGKLEGQREAIIGAFEKGMENFSTLRNHLEQNIVNPHTRASLLSDLIRTFLDMVHSVFAYRQYSKDPKAYEIINYLRVFEIELYAMLESYIDEHGKSLRSSASDLALPDLKKSLLGSTLDDPLMIGNSRKLEIIEGLKYLKVTGMSESEIDEILDDWHYYIANVSSLDPDITTGRIDEIRREIEGLYKAIIQGRLEEAGLSAGFLKNIAFRDGEKVVADIAGHGYNTTNDGKIEQQERYRSLAIGGMASKYLDMLTPLSVFQVRCEHRRI